MRETDLLNILKLNNDMDIAKIKQILFATNMKKIFKNFLKVITTAQCPI